MAAKRDPMIEDEVLDWCFSVIGEPRTPGTYEEVLKDGVVLAK